jgi:hypothetical protein
MCRDYNPAMKTTGLAPDVETISRATEQGVYLLKTFWQEHEKESFGKDTEFARGNLAGFRIALRSVFNEIVAEEIINRVRETTKLKIPPNGPLSKDGKGYVGFDSGADF